MARAVERIEQEIAALQQTVKTIAQEFYDTYSQYLIALGQAVRQQLILASYHICTHGYPERFLKLSFSQRQELQQALRRLTREAQTQIGQQLITSELDLTSLHADRNSESSAQTDAEALNSSEPANPFDLEPHLNEYDLTDRAPNADSEPEVAESAIAFDQLTTPQQLEQWQSALEERLVEALQDFSHEANRLLQRTNILSSRLPEPVLEVAAKADLTTETGNSPPNLLNLLVETEPEDLPEKPESAVTQVMAIRLRLIEIEFGDTNVALWRSKIRTLSNQLAKLGREYQKKQKERSIAEAESAWRSSWYED